LELNGQGEGTFWGVDEIKAADLQLHLKPWTGNPEAYDMLQYFVEDQIGVWNWEGFANDDYAALLDQARLVASLTKPDFQRIRL